MILTLRYKGDDVYQVVHWVECAALVDGKVFVEYKDGVKQEFKYEVDYFSVREEVSK